jgi:4-amino-4-deoxy-L-arabinose transferase-like glycosyltransferase
VTIATIRASAAHPARRRLADNAAPMLTRDGAGRILRARWPPLVALAATLGYAVVVIGFGLDFRPLHNDEGVTLGVASRPSALDVLRVAVDDRHGPPLHYLLVHASLAWRSDILGLRLPSAVLGIVAVAVSYGFGRELVGRAGGAVVAVVTASSPITIHLGQFARGYTAMIAAAYASAWLMLLLIRTGKARWVGPYAIAALLLVSAHPFGLFALFSELVLMAIFAGVRLRRGLRAQRRLAIAVAAALVLGGLAFLLLRHLYSPLQGKYGVGSGTSVIKLESQRFWERFGDAVSGSSHIAFAVVLAVATALGVAALARRNPRAATFSAVWILLPLALLSVLTATSGDFAPERHLSFLLPGYATAIAGFALELRARAGARFGGLIAAAVVAVLLAPGWVADHNELANFNADLRDASLYTAARFGPDDVLATSAGTLSQAEDPRLIGAYAVLAAPGSSPLSTWQHAGSLRGCKLADRIGQRHQPIGTVWLIMSVRDPVRVGRALRRGGAEVRGFGTFLVVSAIPRRPIVVSALITAHYLFHVAVEADPSAYDVRRMVRLYRHAAALDVAGVC